jgi:tetratricopeptide (TPR) repeat protein
LKQEAVDVARRVAEAFPGDALTSALLGSAFYNTGKAGDAIPHLRKCLELNPGQTDAYDILAKIAYERGDLEETVRLCDTALKHAPPNADVLNRRGRALMDLGRIEESIQCLEQSASLPSATAESHYLLGQARLQAGQPGPARETFLRVIQRVPDHTQAFFGLFTACQRLGLAEEGARARERFLALEANDRKALNDRSSQEETLSGLPLVRTTMARTLFGAAQIYRMHKQPGPAADLLVRAALLDPSQIAYRGALESHFAQRNAAAEGIAAFEKLAAAQPTNHLNQLFLGRLNARLRQSEPAERAYLKVIALAPDFPEGYRALADFYLRSGQNPTQARTLAEKAVALEPSPQHFNTLAQALARNNDRPGAIAAMKQAVELAPGEARYREILEQLQKAPGARP